MAYIEVEKAQDFLRAHMSQVNKNVQSPIYSTAMRHAIEYIGCVPRENAIKVVYCENCTKFISTDAFGGVCGLHYRKVERDDYCSDGHRK